MPNELRIGRIGFLYHCLHAGCVSVVHCAAQKYPDKLEADYERSVALNVASTGWLAAATKEVGNSKIPNNITEVRTLNQFSGSESVGAICFWTLWIRSRNLFVQIQIRILPSTSKKMKKPL